MYEILARRKGQHIKKNASRTQTEEKANKEFYIRHFYTQVLYILIDAFTHRRFYTQTHLDTNAFLQRCFYTQTPLHTMTLLHTVSFTHGGFTQRRFYTPTQRRFAFTHTHTHFYAKTLYTQTLLHTNITQTLLHTDAFTHRSFTHRRFHIQTLFTHRRFLHTDTFTHEHFYTQTLLHANTFTHTHRRFYTPNFLETNARTNVHTQRRMDTRTSTHTLYIYICYNINNYIYIHAHTHTDAHAHTHRHTHRQTHKVRSKPRWHRRQRLHEHEIMLLLYMSRPFGRSNLLQQLHLQSFDGLSKTKTRSWNFRFARCSSHFWDFGCQRQQWFSRSRDARRCWLDASKMDTHEAHQTLAATQAGNNLGKRKHDTAVWLL